MSNLKVGDFIELTGYTPGDMDSYFVVTGFGKDKNWRGEYDTVLCKLVVYENGSRPKSKNLKERSYQLSRAKKVTPKTIAADQARQFALISARWSDISDALFPDNDEESELEREEEGDFLKSLSGSLLRREE
jgi:hypothetical protein